MAAGDGDWRFDRSCSTSSSTGSPLRQATAARSWLRRNTFAGSYSSLSATQAARRSSGAVGRRGRAPRPSSERKFTYVPPVSAGAERACRRLGPVDRVVVAVGRERAGDDVEEERRVALAERGRVGGHARHGAAEVVDVDLGLGRGDARVLGDERVDRARRRARAGSPPSCSCGRRGPTAGRCRLCIATYGIGPNRSATGVAELAQRAQRALAVLGRARRRRRARRRAGLPCHSSGRNGAGGRGQQVHQRRQLVGRGRRSQLAVDAQDVGRACRPGRRPAPPMTIGPTACSRYSNEVTTPKLPPPPRRPQNSSAFSSSLACTSRPSAVTTSAPIRLSAGEAVLAHQPADAAAEREAGDAGAGHEAAGGGEAERLRLVVEARSRSRRPARARCGAGIDLDALHRREVDDDAAVDAGEAGDAVPAAADRDGQLLAAGELERADDVGHAGAAGDQRGVAVDARRSRSRAPRRSRRRSGVRAAPRMACRRARRSSPRRASGW